MRVFLSRFSPRPSIYQLDRCPSIRSPANVPALILFFVLVTFVSTHSRADEHETASAVLQELITKLCRAWPNTQSLVSNAGVENVSDSRIRVGRRFSVQLLDGSTVELDVVIAQDKPRQFLATYSNIEQAPMLLLALNASCDFHLARRMHYDSAGMQSYFVELDSEFRDRGQPQWLNPPLPSHDPGANGGQLTEHSSTQSPVKVALVDSGVNYQIPEIYARLAKTNAGELLAFDYWDMDQFPFDAHPGRSPFFVRRHGTRTASLLIHDAPQAELVAYRYPRPDMTRMRQLIKHAVSHGVKIIALPMGGRDRTQWMPFYQAAQEHSDILFISSAGNDGRDIDQQPLYPASFDLENLLVVTSADDFVRPAQGTNWGRQSVDYLLPAEMQAVTDFNGEITLASGSSYAVARLAALAANIARDLPVVSAGEIIARIQRDYSVPDLTESVAVGVIPDPLRVRFSVPPATAQAVPELHTANSTQLLDLDVLILDSNWTQSAVSTLLTQAFDLLSGCRVGVGEIAIKSIEVPDYLRHLSIGSAYTLLGAEPQKVMTVVLANDTRMLDAYEAEAFGLGNTRTRPWLRNSVWLTRTISHPGNALAHELYHVLANDGRHSDEPGNLMHARTSTQNVDLTDAQCQRMVMFASQHGLIRAN